MGNKIEEQAFGNYMPEAFKERCPVCKTEWKHNAVDSKVQIECLECRQGRINQCKAAAWDAVSGCYTSVTLEAWQKLWRSLVWRFGMRGAIAMCEKSEATAVE
jgi:hypothetical protein